MIKGFFRKYSKKKGVRIGFLACIILLAGFLIWGSVYYSKSSVINRYITAYSKSGDVFENIKEYVVWSDTGKQITNEETKYTKFSRLDTSTASQLSEELKTASSSDGSYVKRVGSRFLVFPNYRIAFEPMSLIIKTNVNKVDISLNEKKVSTSDSEDYSVTVERLPLSDYTASISGTYNKKPISLSKTYDGKDKTLDLSVSFKNFTVTSNLTDGELYFDKTRIGTLKDGQYEVSDYPVTESAKAYVKKVYSDGDLKSKEQLLSEISEGEEVVLNAENFLDETTAGQVLVSAFDQLIAYLTAGQDPSNIATVFEDGANNDFYKGLKESISAKMTTDQRKATSLNIPSIVLNSMTQVGKESYLINFSAQYVFYYDKSTDTSKNTSGNIIQDLTGQVTMKKSGKSYVISKSGQKNITVTSEVNQVKTDSVFPENVIGSWSRVAYGNVITMTFKEDGTVTKKVDYGDGNQSVTMSAKVNRIEEKGLGIYHYIYDDNVDTSAFVAGGGLGGVNIKYTFGIKIDGGTITPIVWQTGVNDDFDYSKPLPGLPLTKQ